MGLIGWPGRQGKRIWQFLTTGLWTRDLSGTPRATRFLYRSFRVTVLAGRGFFSYRLRSRAAALTLVTMLSIAPLLAASFSVAKGLGYHELRRHPAGASAHRPAGAPQPDRRLPPPAGGLDPELRGDDEPDGPWYDRDGDPLCRDLLAADGD